MSSSREETTIEMKRSSASSATAKMAQRLQQEHGVGPVLVIHRVGRLPPGEPIVLVAVQADRRGAAQRCSADLLEELKHGAPFWKREWCGDQGTWLTGNTPL